VLSFVAGSNQIFRIPEDWAYIYEERPLCRIFLDVSIQVLQAIHSRGDGHHPGWADQSKLRSIENQFVSKQEVVTESVLIVFPDQRDHVRIVHQVAIDQFIKGDTDLLAFSEESIRRCGMPNGAMELRSIIA
jgi:hypothetical protein